MLWYAEMLICSVSFFAENCENTILRIRTNTIKSGRLEGMLVAKCALKTAQMCLKVSRDEQLCLDVSKGVQNCQGNRGEVSGGL